MYFILATIYNYVFACFGDDLNANDRYVRKISFLQSSHHDVLDRFIQPTL